MKLIKYLFISLLVFAAVVFYRMQLEIPQRPLEEIPGFFKNAAPIASEATPPAPGYFCFYDQLASEQKLIHMLFFPWDQDQKYLDDEFAFDHNPYLQMVERIPDGRVVMWTRSKTKEFCLKYYPEIWEILETYSSRNIMKIDILRWLFVYHFGGAYWQYDSLMLGSVDDLFPSSGKRVRFFEYKRHFFYHIQNGVLHPLRNWELNIVSKPFSIRMVQGISPVVFASAGLKNPVIKNLINFLIDRLQSGVVQNDGDIIYLTGNQAVTEFYHYFARFESDVELIPVIKTQELININSKGRWRMNNRNAALY